MSVIGVGVVGIGAICRHVHLPGILRSPNLALVAICDTDPVARQWAQETYGLDPCCCFANYEDLIACPAVDAVDIATPNHAHYPIALAAARAKKHYSVEKPLTLTSAEADHLAQVTKECGVKSMVCFSYRFKASARYARALIQKGMLGQIYHVDTQYYQAWGLPFYQTPLKWRFQKQYTGSGALGDLGSHALDLLRFVTGQELTKLMSHTGTFIAQRALENGTGVGTVDVDDFANYLAELDGGGAASFRITRFGYGRGNYQTMEIYGSEGAIVYTLDHTAPDEDTLSICIGTANADAHVFTRIPIPAEYKVDQMQCFADLLQGKNTSLAATVQDGQINQHAVDAVIESAHVGAWVPL